MSIPRGHQHLTEREIEHRWPDGRLDDRHWEDCTFCAGVELARLCHDRNIPPIHLEAEALRAASGEPPAGGSNTYNLADGFEKRYGWTTGWQRVSGSADLLAALTPGHAAAIAGTFKNFPAAHRLRRWQWGFNTGHCVLLVRLPDGSLWWCDPLAPTGDYQGEPVTATEVRTFVDSFAGANLVATTLEAQNLQAPITTVGPKLIDIPAGAEMLELDGKTVIKTIKGPTGTGYKDVYSPYGVGTGIPLYELRAWVVTIDGKKRMALIRGAVNRRPFATDPALAKQVTLLTDQLKAARAALTASNKAGWNDARIAAVSAVTAVPKK
jgi:hypothetical protein